MSTTNCIPTQQLYSSQKNEYPIKLKLEFMQRKVILKIKDRANLPLTKTYYKTILMKMEGLVRWLSTMSWVQRL